MAPNQRASDVLLPIILRTEFDAAEKRLDRCPQKLSVKLLLILFIALLVMGSFPTRPVMAQSIVYLTGTPLYRPGTPLNPNLGIGVHIATEANLAEAAADGFTWVRVGPSWESVEKVPGHYDWTAFDTTCKLCRKYRLKPHWLLFYGNPLYGSAGTDAGITAFANYAKACAAESVAQGIPGAHYEIWNEPENFGWLGTLYNQPHASILSGSQVAQINNASVGPIHAADSTALVCTSAFGSLNTEVYWGKPAFAGSPQGNPPIPGIDYNGAFDAIALHQYSLGQFYKSAEGKNGNDNPECLMAYNPSDPAADLYSNVTQVMIPAYVPGKKTYWVTESGRQLDNDCAGSQDGFSYEWVRTTLCQWMAGIQWQGLYDLDSDGSWNLQGAAKPSRR